MRYTIPILWVLLSTALFTGLYATAKLADGATSTFQIFFLRYLGGFAVLALMAHWQGGLLAQRSRHLGKHAIRAVLGCFAGVCITWSSARMPIADATAIGMLFGVLSVLAGALFLGERVRPLHWLAVLASLCGAVVVVAGQGAFKAGLALLPVGVALLSAVLMTGEALFIRVLSQRDSAMSMMLHVSGFGILLLAPLAWWTWQPSGVLTIILCLALGPLASVAQYCTIRGYRSAPLSVVGPVDYSWLIFASLLGVVAFGENPGLHLLVGGGLILGGGVMLARLR